MIFIEALRQFTAIIKSVSVNFLIAALIAALGIFMGKLVKLVLRKIFERMGLPKIFKFGSIEAGLTIIKWSIYLFFFGFAIDQLKIPYLSTSFVSALTIIPKSIGAYIVIILGFLIGKFFQEAIAQTKKKELNLLGEISLNFFVYLAFMISIQLIFANDDYLVRWISVLFTGFYLLFAVIKYGWKK